MNLLFIKVLYIILLFVVFFSLFGMKSLSQFLDGKYNLVTEMLETDGDDVPAPSFTVLKYKNTINSTEYFRDQVYKFIISYFLQS